MSILAAPEELDDLLGRTSPDVRAGVRALTRGIVLDQTGGGYAELRDARAGFKRVCGGIVEYGNLLGRRRMLVVSRFLRQFATSARGRRFELSIPRVPFQKAIEEMYNREPKLADSSAEIRQLYREQKAFAMVRSTEETLTARVQSLITDAMRTAYTTDQVVDAILETANAEGHDFSYWYGETVFRTNIAGVYSEGLRQMARDPDVREVVPAFRYTAVGDADTRPGHAALDGLIAATDDAIWALYMPPIFYNCRCGWDLMDVFELEDMGLITEAGTVITYYPDTWEARETEELFALAA